LDKASKQKLGEKWEAFPLKQQLNNLWASPVLHCTASLHASSECAVDNHDPQLLSVGKREREREALEVCTAQP